MTQELDANWLAALIDGEGSLNIALEKHGTRFSVVLYFGIANKCKELLEPVVRSFKGRLSVIKMNNAYYFEFARCEHKRVLEMVKDKLIAKKELAYLMLEYLKYRETKSTIHFTMTDVEFARKFREALGKHRKIKDKEATIKEFEEYIKSRPIRTFNRTRLKDILAMMEPDKEYTPRELAKLCSITSLCEVYNYLGPLTKAGLIEKRVIAPKQKHKKQGRQTFYKITMSGIQRRAESLEKASQLLGR